MSERDDGVRGARRARVDSGTETPKEIAERVYTTTFLAALGEQFGFEAQRSDRAELLKRIASRYILGLRWENQPDFLKSERRNYLALKKETEHFLTLLQRHDESEVGSDMKMIAQQQGRAATDPKDSKQYFRQLIISLELLKAATAQQAGFLASRGGRPKNFGLEDLTRHAANFWVGELGQPFSVDYHQGSGLTSAFEFLEALIEPLDDVTDTQIVTAMRAEIASRRSPGRFKIKGRSQKPGATEA